MTTLSLDTKATKRGRKRGVPSVCAASLPAISMDDALTAWFRLDEGSVHCVGTCRSTFLYDLVEQVASTWSGEQHLQLMDTLELDDRIGRWQVITALIELNTGLRLYPSAEQARQAACHEVLR